MASKFRYPTMNGLGFCNSCGNPATRGISIGSYRSPHGNTMVFRVFFCPRCWVDRFLVESTIHKYLPVLEAAKRYLERKKTDEKEVTFIGSGRNDSINAGGSKAVLGS